MSVVNYVRLVLPTKLEKTNDENKMLHEKYTKLNDLP